MITTNGIIPQNAQNNSVDPVVCELGQGCADVELVASWDGSNHPVLAYNQPFQFGQIIQQLMLERSIDQVNWDLVVNGFPLDPTTTIPLDHFYTDTDVTLVGALTYYYRMTASGPGGSFIYNIVRVNLSNDITDPRVEIVYPYDGATVSGTFPITVSCQDDLNLARVDMYVSDQGTYVLVASIQLAGTNADATFNLDTTLRPFSNGNHSIICRVFDGAGNSTLSTNSVTVNLANPITEPGNLVFTEIAGHSPLTGSCQIVDTKIDSAGRTVVVGIFQGVINFLGTTLTSAGGYDLFIAQLNQTGGLIWVHSYGGPYDDVVSSVAIGPSDSIFIFGQHVGTFSLGGSNITSNGGNTQPDFFLAKYDQSGNHVWSKGFGGSHGNFGNGVMVDFNGDVYVCGDYNFQADFGGGTRTSAGSADGFFAKYSGVDGSYIWDKELSGPAFNIAGKIILDFSGLYLYVIGYTFGDVNMGGGNLTFLGGNQNGCIGKYRASDGAHAWSRLIGGNGSAVTSDCIALDPPTGHIYMTGTMNYTFSIDAISFPAVTAGTYLVRLNRDTGVAIAGRVIGGNSSVGGNVNSFGLFSDSSGVVVVAGICNGEVDFGNGQVTAGTGQMFIVKYRPTLGLETCQPGNFTAYAGASYWFARYGAGGGANCIAKAVATNAARDVVFVGGFQGSITIGGLTLSSASAQTQDGFVTKFTA